MRDVLIIESNALLREAIAETVSHAGFSHYAVKSCISAFEALEQYHPSLVLCDLDSDKAGCMHFLAALQSQKSELPVLVVTSSAETVLNYERLSKPFSAQELEKKILYYLRGDEHAKDKFPIIHDLKSQQLFTLAKRVARADVGVMISGDSGTGKEVLAHFIHEHSARFQQPFIAINCAAIPEQMLEATLFGYEKGAFTGAYKSSAGKFEQAQGGTLLLDEISEMSLALQAKLLRVLQEKEVERIGSNHMLSLDVRVIATANKPIFAEVKAGRFREDLYYRLNVFPLRCDPLRERPDDILPLVQYFLRRRCADASLPILSETSRRILRNYTWPGNVRELDNVVQRALVLQTDGRIEPVHLSLERDNKELSEFEQIEQTLLKYNGNRQQTASSLGVSERTLRYKLAKMREEGYLL